MKNAKLKMMGLAGLLAGLAVFTAIAVTQNYGTINIPGDLTWVTTSTSNSTAGATFDIPQNTDLIILPTVHASGASTSNVVYGFNVTTDGTNFTTTAPIQGGVILNGATPATGYIYVSRTNLTGLKQLRFGQCSTTSLATITNDAIRVGWTY